MSAAASDVHDACCWLDQHIAESLLCATTICSAGLPVRASVAYSIASRIHLLLWRADMCAPLGPPEQRLAGRSTTMVQR